MERGPGDEASVKRRPAGGGVELEPTHQAGPCIEDGLPLVDAGEEELHAVVAALEKMGVDEALIRLSSAGGLQVFYHVSWSMEDECYSAAALVLRGCGDEWGPRLLKAADWPEVSKVALDRGCVEIVIPLDPPYRVKKALEKLGVEPEGWSVEGLEPAPPSPQG
ncbi:hypothetical protein APE_1078 [Aeropyrum pernix K1]|uniref:Uncharacterized protein n=1 Tax=Aeropyrum pernix (strain ATCC 700893 / DSM 11879 / JCM 9820 / NBRC 100138 / K1) TaxID=272557 RepID=Q9YD34_AERPE|nr:hypothetical protein [Aeropyrum pernix]BAA80063.1 hypothetical protein APE_1078 [Aeropyrum pernix K1]